MKKAFVTLVTSDAYIKGAIALAHSLRIAHTKYPIVCMATKEVSNTLLSELYQPGILFDEIVQVNAINSEDEASLDLLGRPELGITFTKLNIWTLVQYKYACFLDADTLILQNIDGLLDQAESMDKRMDSTIDSMENARHVFAAAPDVGWPDHFNSGVFLCKPNKDLFDDLVNFANTTGSFDGGDQGLLNRYFKDWLEMPGGRLSFTFNVTPSAYYSYAPAYQEHLHDIRVVHFIGSTKPWFYNPSLVLSSDASTSSDSDPFQTLVHQWWNVYNNYEKSNRQDQSEDKNQVYTNNTTTTTNSHMVQEKEANFNAPTMITHSHPYDNAWKTNVIQEPFVQSEPPKPEEKEMKEALSSPPPPPPTVSYVENKIESQFTPSNHVIPQEEKKEEEKEEEKKKEESPFNSYHATDNAWLTNTIITLEERKEEETIAEKIITEKMIDNVHPTDNAWKTNVIITNEEIQEGKEEIIQSLIVQQKLRKEMEEQNTRKDWLPPVISGDVNTTSTTSTIQNIILTPPVIIQKKEDKIVQQSKPESKKAVKKPVTRRRTKSNASSTKSQAMSATSDIDDFSNYHIEWDMRYLRGFRSHFNKALHQEKNSNKDDILAIDRLPGVHTVSNETIEKENVVIQEDDVYEENGKSIVETEPETEDIIVMGNKTEEPNNIENEEENDDVDKVLNQSLKEDNYVENFDIYGFNYQNQLRKRSMSNSSSRDGHRRKSIIEVLSGYDMSTISGINETNNMDIQDSSVEITGIIEDNFEDDLFINEDEIENLSFVRSRRSSTSYTPAANISGFTELSSEQNAYKNSEIKDSQNIIDEVATTEEEEKILDSMLSTSEEILSKEMEKEEVEVKEEEIDVEKSKENEKTMNTTETYSGNEEDNDEEIIVINEESIDESNGYFKEELQEQIHVIEEDMEALNEESVDESNGYFKEELQERKKLSMENMTIQQNKEIPNEKKIEMVEVLEEDKKEEVPEEIEDKKEEEIEETPKVLEIVETSEKEEITKETSKEDKEKEENDTVDLEENKKEALKKEIIETLEEYKNEIVMDTSKEDKKEIDEVEEVLVEQTLEASKEDNKEVEEVKQVLEEKTLETPKEDKKEVEEVKQVLEEKTLETPKEDNKEVEEVFEEEIVKVSEETKKEEVVKEIKDTETETETKALEMKEDDESKNEETTENIVKVNDEELTEEKEDISNSISIEKDKSNDSLKITIQEPIRTKRRSRTEDITYIQETENEKSEITNSESLDEKTEEIIVMPKKSRSTKTKTKTKNNKRNSKTQSILEDSSKDRKSMYYKLPFIANDVDVVLDTIRLFGRHTELISRFEENTYAYYYHTMTTEEYYQGYEEVMDELCKVNSNDTRYTSKTTPFMIQASESLWANMANSFLKYENNSSSNSESEQSSKEKKRTSVNEEDDEDEDKTLIERRKSRFSFLHFGSKKRNSTAINKEKEKKHSYSHHHSRQSTMVNDVVISDNNIYQQEMIKIWKAHQKTFEEKEVQIDNKVEEKVIESDTKKDNNEIKEIENKENINTNDVKDEVKNEVKNEIKDEVNKEVSENIDEIKSETSDKVNENVKDSENNNEEIKEIIENKKSEEEEKAIEITTEVLSSIEKQIEETSPKKKNSFKKSSKKEKSKDLKNEKKKKKWWKRLSTSKK